LNASTNYHLSLRLNLSGEPNNMPSPSITSPQVAINDIARPRISWPPSTDHQYFNDGDIVEGTIVKVDRDEVLLESVQDRRRHSFP